MFPLLRYSFRKYLGSVSYIVTIVVINSCFSYFPMWHWHQCDISPMDPIAGIVYLMRDFAQQELGHRVFIAMFIGGGLSYGLADPMIANASILAFSVGELIDWFIFTLTARPLSQRLLWSASLSTPIDTLIFLWVINRLNPLAFLLMGISKFAGILLLWSLWRRHTRATTSLSGNVIN